MSNKLIKIKDNVNPKKGNMPLTYLHAATFCSLLTANCPLLTAHCRLRTKD
ncbi:MAG: hypothetical protein RL732_263 [Bacteroidota bacterium]